MTPCSTVWTPSRQGIADELIEKDEAPRDLGDIGPENVAVDVFPIWKTVSNIEYDQEGDFGKDWQFGSVIEKNLFRQRVFLMCATNREYVSVLNEGAFKPDESGIITKVLEDMTGPTEAFKIASGEMTPGDYANDDTTIFQRGPGTAV